MRKRKFLSEDQKEIVLKEYLSGKSAIQIALDLDCSSNQIYNVLKFNKIERRNNRDCRISTRKVLNDLAFSDFKNDSLSRYFYGLMLADGCLCNSGKTLQITLKSSDSDILIKFKKYLGMESGLYCVKYFHSQINREVEMCQLSFTDPRIINCFLENNFESLKSKKEKLPKFETDSNFWRGMIDGDGYLRKDAGGTPEISLIGSFEVVEGFKTYCEKILKKSLKYNLKQRLCKTGGSVFTYSLFGENCKKVVSELYKNSETYLERKHKIAEEITNGFK